MWQLNPPFSRALFLPVSPKSSQSLGGNGRGMTLFWKTSLDETAWTYLVSVSTHIQGEKQAYWPESDQITFHLHHPESSQYLLSPFHIQSGPAHMLHFGPLLLGREIQFRFVIDIRSSHRAAYGKGVRVPRRSFTHPLKPPITEHPLPASKATVNQRDPRPCPCGAIKQGGKSSQKEADSIFCW